MILAKAPVDKIIRKAGAGRVSEGAIIAMAEYLEDFGISVAKEAAALSKHAGRKTIRAEDITLALERI
ncbi:MAG: NFYB/HAP3 family transcription factor subunit [Methanomicrobia archaeon]|nr:NFYB/HAP3 family transcription factor subunit [Methanomicrobia archaeon]MCK4636597.1 NFYB/HAP3 family transcription factor subunit [Methanomicrobia archaeon]